MSFKNYKGHKGNDPVVYSEKVDSYFKDNYGFEVTENCFGYGVGLEKVIPLKYGERLWINLTNGYIYLYQEFDCGGKTWDLEVCLYDKDVYDENRKVDASKLEDLLDDLIDI